MSITGTNKLDHRIFIRLSEPEDAAVMAPNLREADRNEIAARTAQEPLQALTESMSLSSTCLTGTYLGEPFAICGVCPVIEGVGAIWLLGTDAVMNPKVSRQFLRFSKLYVDQFQHMYPLLFNYIDARNTVHIKWLKWLGFQFINLHQKFGVGKLPFYEFVRI